MRPLALVCAVMLVCATPAAAASRYDALFVAAAAAYDGVDLERAIDGFGAAAAAAENDDERRDALLWWGVAAGQAGKTDEAEDAFRKAVALDDRARLPTAVSPKVAALFARVRDENRPPPTPTPSPLPLPLPAPSSPPPPQSTAPSSLTPPSTAPSTSPDPLAVGLLAGSGLFVAAGVVAGVVAAVDLSTALDPQTAQAPAKEALDRGNVALVVGGLAAGGAMAFGVGWLLRTNEAAPTDEKTPP